MHKLQHAQQLRKTEPVKSPQARVDFKEMWRSRRDGSLHSTKEEVISHNRMLDRLKTPDGQLSPQAKRAIEAFRADPDRRQKLNAAVSAFRKAHAI